MNYQNGDELVVFGEPSTTFRYLCGKWIEVINDEKEVKPPLNWEIIKKQPPQIRYEAF